MSRAASKAVGQGSRRRGLRASLVRSELSFCPIRSFLLADRGADLFQFETDGGYHVSADPEMFALTRASAHPSGKYVAYQSGDNQIVVFAAGDKFRQNRKKGFRGMNTAGLAVDVAISPDGNLIASGDSGGYACFWDWKTGKMLHKFLATEGMLGSKDGGGRIGEPVTNIAWNWQETSKVVTGGRDGLIRYWD